MWHASHLILLTFGLATLTAPLPYRDDARPGEDPSQRQARVFRGELRGYGGPDFRPTAATGDIQVQVADGRTRGIVIFGRIRAAMGERFTKGIIIYGMGTDRPCLLTEFTLPTPRPGTPAEFRVSRRLAPGAEKMLHEVNDLVAFVRSESGPPKAVSGWLRPGEAKGFNPQPDPPGVPPRLQACAS